MLDPVFVVQDASSLFVPGRAHHLPSQGNERAAGQNQRPVVDPSGAEGSRTPDLLNAIQALSQLSYGPDTNFRRPSNPETRGGAAAYHPSESISNISQRG